jgi:hypothetical protein
MVTKPKEPVAEPARLENVLEHEGYRNATAELRTWRDKKADLQHRIDDMIADVDPSERGSPRTLSPLAVEAAALRKGEPYRPAADGVVELQKLYHELAVVGEIVRQCELQVMTAHSEASRLICEQRLPAYRQEIMSPIDAALGLLLAALAKEERFFADLDKTGSKRSLPIHKIAWESMRNKAESKRAEMRNDGSIID